MTKEDRNAPSPRPSVEAYRRAEAGRIALLSLLAAVDYTVHQYQAGKLPNLTLGELMTDLADVARETHAEHDREWSGVAESLDRASHLFVGVPHAILGCHDLIRSLPCAYMSDMVTGEHCRSRATFALRSNCACEWEAQCCTEHLPHSIRLAAKQCMQGIARHYAGSTVRVTPIGEDQ